MDARRKRDILFHELSYVMPKIMNEMIFKTHYPRLNPKRRILCLISKVDD